MVPFCPLYSTSETFHVKALKRVPTLLDVQMERGLCTRPSLDFLLRRILSLYINHLLPLK